MARMNCNGMCVGMNRLASVKLSRFPSVTAWRFRVSPANLVALALAVSIAPVLDPSTARAADDDFQLHYSVQRTDVARLNPEQCANIVATRARAAGLRTQSERHAGKLAVVSGGPASGGWSFMVYCIADGSRLVYQSQSIAYRPDENMAGQFVHDIDAALQAAVAK